MNLTHACNDTVHRELRGAVENVTILLFLAVMRFLSDSKCRVFFLSDVDVVAGVSSSHEMTRTRVQQDDFIIFSLYSYQTNSIPTHTHTQVVANDVLVYCSVLCSVY